MANLKNKQSFDTVAKATEVATTNQYRWLSNIYVLDSHESLRFTFYFLRVIDVPGAIIMENANPNLVL
jgi:hypothetical protein